MNENTGHGHVRPRPDGVLARCGGPSICRVCALEAGKVRGAVPIEAFKGPRLGPDELEAMFRRVEDMLVGHDISTMLAVFSEASINVAKAGGVPRDVYLKLIADAWDSGERDLTTESKPR